MVSAHEALIRLQAGNQRFVAGKPEAPLSCDDQRRAELLTAQRPFAVVLGCSDSRVPAEIIFDQGLGALFVIRVAGNIVAPSQIGSIEFAAEWCETRLVVVLGHSHCGAIQATLRELSDPAGGSSSHLRSIVSRIRPALEPLLATELKKDPAALMNQAVRANVRMSVNQLRHSSALLENLAENDGLLIVGAEYSLESGLVDFFDISGH